VLRRDVDLALASAGSGWHGRAEKCSVGEVGGVDESEGHGFEDSDVGEVPVLVDRDELAERLVGFLFSLGGVDIVRMLVEPPGEGRSPSTSGRWSDQTRKGSAAQY